jgi:DHA1 family bicyclomycin/chloramphenicol resistance-like MFS transporter
MKKIKPGSKFIILILGALTTISPFSIDMYLPAFSQLAKDFGTTPAKISLSVSSYFVGLAFGQMLYGPLLDRYGRKRPLYFGLTVFILASIGCTLSTNIETLIVFRFIQALGGCVAWVGSMTMVRDFFPVEESVRIFSWLILILGVSPLLAPTLGGFIAASLGWQWIFITLALIVFVILVVTLLFLPEGQAPDPTISLKARPMLETFLSILKNSQFSTYTFAGAFAFASLFIYVAGSPVIFMETYQLSPQVYGSIFALLSVGFIGGSQLNIILTKKFSSEQIFRFVLTCQVITNVSFLIFAWNDWIGLAGTIFFFSISLSCIGIINPNASGLALAPFTRNVGSASALIGCLQIGVAAIASSCVGLFNSSNTAPIIAILAGTSVLAYTILMIGRYSMGKKIISVQDVQGRTLH